MVNNYLIHERWKDGTQRYYFGTYEESLIEFIKERLKKSKEIEEINLYKWERKITK